jgi:hypothetical protein
MPSLIKTVTIVVRRRKQLAGRTACLCRILLLASCLQRFGGRRADLSPHEERENYLSNVENTYSLQTGAEPEPYRIKLIDLNRINHNRSWTWSRTNLINLIQSLIKPVKPDRVKMNFFIINLNKYVKL